METTHVTTRQPPEVRHSRSRGRAPSVLLAGKLDAMIAPGGGEIQLAAMAEALPAVGVDARRWRPWEESFAAADVLHLFGSVPEHLPLVEAARRQGVAVVLSPIAWFALADAWRQPRPIGGRLAACGRFAARAACPRLPSWRRRLYHAVDRLLPNSRAEARQLTHYFQVPPERIHVVSNGADERFADADAEAFVDAFGLRDFVLYVGRIEPRKNQLGFLRAMRGSGLPLVVLGDVVPGHEAYLAACRDAADANVHFLPRLEHDDPRLAGAYAACTCLALASWFETPGLVALEAGMSGTPLVLPEGGCAREYFGPMAEYVKPNDLSGIRRAVLAAMGRPRDPGLAEHVREHCSWHAAAEATKAAYAKVLRAEC